MKDLVIIINGGGTNGAELKSLYKELAKDEKYFVYYPGYMPGMFIGNYFPKSKTKDFIKFIDETIEMANDFENVYVIGYSLGASTSAIIATRLAHVKKLVLIAPVVKNPSYPKFIRGLTRSLTISKGLSRVQKVFYNEFIKRFIKVPKIHIYHLQRYLFFTRKYLRRIDKPTMIVETLKDEMVSKRSIDFLERNIKNDHVERYSVNSSHFLFFDKNVRNDVTMKIVSYLKEEIA